MEGRSGRLRRVMQNIVVMVEWVVGGLNWWLRGVGTLFLGAVL